MILGIDVSKWQGEMNWAKAAAAGAQFAFLRAGACGTDGVNYKDDQWDNNIAKAPAYMPVGAYWYFRPDKSTPLAQAQYFAGIVSNQPVQLPLVMDIETNGSLGASTVKDRVKNFAYNIKSLTGQYPMAYTRSSFWNTYVGDSELWEILDLWIARYTTGSVPWTGTTLKPRDWSTWQFWQWSADNNHRGAEFGAQSASIDIDYFNGTMEDLQKRYRVPGAGTNPSIASAFIKSYGKESDDWYITLGLVLA